jgi:hypothetical protein
MLRPARLGQEQRPLQRLAGSLQLTRHHERGGLCAVPSRAWVAGARDLPEGRHQAMDQGRIEPGEERQLVDVCRAEPV